MNIEEMFKIIFTYCIIIITVFSTIAGIIEIIKFIFRKKRRKQWYDFYE